MIKLKANESQLVVKMGLTDGLAALPALNAQSPRKRCNSKGVDALAPADDEQDPFPASDADGFVGRMHA